jgi:hypothetical protein
MPVSIGGRVGDGLASLASAIVKGVNGELASRTSGEKSRLNVDSRECICPSPVGWPGVVGVWSHCYTLSFRPPHPALVEVVT